jgi:hypothetical protein
MTVISLALTKRFIYKYIYISKLEYAYIRYKWISDRPNSNEYKANFIIQIVTYSN